MAKLPARVKVSVLLFRRSGPDEVLLVQRDVRRAPTWGLPSVEAEHGEAVRDAALRLAATLAAATPVLDLEAGVEGSYRVGDGPRAGEWTERFHAVEVPAGARARDGTWLPHYEAKSRAGADAPRVREAFSAVRERARLKP